MFTTQPVQFSNAPAVNNLRGLEEALFTLRSKTRTVISGLSECEMSAWYLPAELSPHARRRDLSLIRVVQGQDRQLLSIVEDVRRGMRQVLAHAPHSRRRRDWAARLEQRLLEERPACPSWDSMGINPISANLLDLKIEHSRVVRQRYEQQVDYATTVIRLLDELLEAGIFTEPTALPMDKIDVLHHSRFEKLIGDLLDRDGYRVVRSGGGAGDLGADVLAIDDFDRHIMVQTKHFSGGNGSVGQPVAQHLFGGASAIHPVALPIVVTNGKFTGSAKMWSKEDARVRLIGRDELARWSEGRESLADVLRAQQAA
ncbi:restriction endonuclease [Streptomyces globosus]|uniref:restriction endonuclease n=1 Tax=Streptomyces globosus TaxID=68209 RepID=UPI0013B3901C|nr:restriction endonuclease [Streptomyces globosus]